MKPYEYGIPPRFATAGEHPELASGRESVCLFGAIGTGKTYRAIQHAVAVLMKQRGAENPEAIVQAMNGGYITADYERVYPFAFVDVGVFMAKLRSLEIAERGALLHRIQKTPLLVLDDLGHDARTDFAIDTYTQIVFDRYNADRPTIVTTNFTAEGLTSRIREPLVSRLLELCEWVEVKGADRRRFRRVG